MLAKAIARDAGRQIGSPGLSFVCSLARIAEEKKRLLTWQEIYGEEMQGEDIYLFNFEVWDIFAIVSS